MLLSSPMLLALFSPFSPWPIQRHVVCSLVLVYVAIALSHVTSVPIVFPITIHATNPISIASPIFSIICPIIWLTVDPIVFILVPTASMLFTLAILAIHALFIVFLISPNVAILSANVSVLSPNVSILSPFVFPLSPFSSIGIP